MITPRAARPYLRGQALKKRQAKTYAALLAEIVMRDFDADLQKRIDAINAPAPREGDPFGDTRAMFAALPPRTAGRAMAAKIMTDARAAALLERFDRDVAEAVELDLLAEFPELNDMDFAQTAGMV